MEKIGFKDRESHMCGRTGIHEYREVVPEVGIKELDVNERYPLEGWIENGEGLAILQVIKKYGSIIRPDAEPPELCVRAGDQIYIMPNEQYALEGSMNVLSVTLPAQRHDQEKHIR